MAGEGRGRGQEERRAEGQAGTGFRGQEVRSAEGVKDRKGGE